MKPGLKPMHLWGWTPRKWYESVLKEYQSIKNIDQRDRNEILKTNFVVISIGLSIMYSFGMIDPKAIVTRLMNENSCSTAAQSKESKPEPVVKELPPEPEPVCPPKKPKELPKCP